MVVGVILAEESHLFLLSIADDLFPVLGHVLPRNEGEFPVSNVFISETESLRRMVQIESEIVHVSSLVVFLW
jgi:hypothetical protein